MAHMLQTIKVELLVQIELGEGEYIAHCSATNSTTTGDSPKDVMDKLQKQLMTREQLTRDEILNAKNNTPAAPIRPATLHGKGRGKRTKSVGA